MRVKFFKSCMYYAMSNGGGEKYFEDLVNYCRENAVHSHFINMDIRYTFSIKSQHS